MPRSSVRLTSQFASQGEAEDALDRVAALRNWRGMSDLLEKSLTPVLKAAQRYVTQPGYPGDRPGLKPLKETISVEVKRSGTLVTGTVGPRWPAGAHGYNVEHGHEGPAPAPPHPYMEPAIEATAVNVQRQFEGALIKEVEARFSG